MRSGLTYLSKVYALECLRWAAGIENKLSLVDVKSMKEWVQDIPGHLVALALHALQHGTDGDKLEAVVRCASIATIDKDAVKLRKAGIVAPLVTLLRDGSDMHKLWAAEALKNLCCDEAIRAEMVEKQAIGPLTALLRVGTDEQKHRAALALGNLAANHDAAREIGHKHAIDPLAALVKIGTQIQKRCAAFALGNLALDDANRVEMVRACTIPRWLRFCKRKSSWINNTRRML